MPEITKGFEQLIYTALEYRYGATGQIVVFIEELAELQQALTKWLRYFQVDGQGDLIKIIAHVREEMADVSIVLKQLEIFFGNTSDIQEKKLKRTYGLVADLFDDDGNIKPVHWWDKEEE